MRPEVSWRRTSADQGFRSQDEFRCAGARLDAEGALIVRGLVIVGCATFWIGTLSLFF